MPELPEVETMRRGVAAVAGCRIVRVERPRSNKRPIQMAPPFASLSRRLVGRTITAVDRIGKRMVLRLDDGKSLVVEPRMTGLVLLADPPTREHLRLRLLLEGGAAQLLFWDRRGLGVVRLVNESQFAALYGPEKLGPDALGIAADELAARLAHSRRAIKVALLDQRALAGVGNLYASELLHLAGIDPRLRCEQLRPAGWERLQEAMHAVLQAAIRHEGSTLSDGTYRNALNSPGSYQNHHRVYDRAGQPCSTCGNGEIVRIVQAQRATFFCPVCQPSPRPSPRGRGRRSAGLPNRRQ
jgi:formamidopyrimidine-DNA glycosylase